MKIAFLSDANSPGVFRHVPRDWAAENTIEAIAAELDAEVWHGRELNHLVMDSFLACDAILINLKQPLWGLIPRLKAAVGGRIPVYGYQEGPSDEAGRLDADQIEAYVDAYRLVDRLFVFDPAAVEWFKALRGDDRVHHLPIPAPVGVYGQFRRPWTDRPDNPPRIALCQPIGDRRGAYLNMVLAARIRPGCIIVCGSRPGEAEQTSWLIHRLGCVPHVFGWLDWKPNPYAKRKRRSWLEELADCRLALNLDLHPCYGRMQVDCFGLRVPCLGSMATVAQRALDVIDMGYRDVRDTAGIIERGKSIIAGECESYPACDLSRTLPYLNTRYTSRLFMEAVQCDLPVSA